MENFIIANCTDPGRIRFVNEDSMTTFDSPNGRVVAVCDGMGGQNAGDVASQLAVTVIKDILTDNTFPTPEEAINRSIFAANQAILLKSNQNPELAGMGATCVMLIIKDGLVYFGSVGDSRIYIVCNHTIRQLTKDQSYVQTLVDAGEISQEAAEHHQDKNQITNALGLEGMTAPVICPTPITPEPGSVFVLCSDGLSGMVNNKGIQSTVSRYDLPLAERAKMLIQQANEAGGLDNITVQLVEFHDSASAAAQAPSTAMGATHSEYQGQNNQQKKRNMLPLIIIIVALVLAIAGGAYWFLSSPGKPQEPLPSTIVIKKQVPASKPKVVTPTVNREVVVMEPSQSQKKNETKTSQKQKQQNTVKKVIQKETNKQEETDKEKDKIVMDRINAKGLKEE